MTAEDIAAERYRRRIRRKCEEINIARKYRHLPLPGALAALRARPVHRHGIAAGAPRRRS